MNILVLCTGNSARSILLESILNRFGNGRVRAFSAGSHPTGQVHPQALALLAAEGFDTSGLRSKSWDEFAAPAAPHMDAVITVCGNAASEVCPIWPGAPVRAHWGVDDPATVPGPGQAAAFRSTFDLLSARAMALLAQPFETLGKPALQVLLGRIATDQ